MKKILLLFIISFSIGTIVSSCGPSEKEIREKIERERQDSIRTAKEKEEALMQEELRKEEEKRKQEEEKRKQWESSEVGKGWAYLKQRLKSPSSAKLVSYAEPNESACREFASEIGLSGLSIASYRVDAQNSFGAMIRSDYFVFFKNGEPKYMEEGNSLSRSGDIKFLRMALEMHGF